MKLLTTAELDAIEKAVETHSECKANRRVLIATARKAIRLLADKASGAVPWRELAIAHLGRVRDSMHPINVAVVQDFLGVPPAPSIPSLTVASAEIDAELKGEP